MTRLVSLSRFQRLLLGLTVIILVMVMFAVAQLVHAQLTEEQQLGQQGIDFLNSLGAGWAVAAIFVIRQVAEVGAKLSPDSQTGFLGILRKVLKIVAVYIPNKS